MIILPLPKKYETCIYCVEDKGRRWIGLTRNYYRCAQQFTKLGKIEVSDEATFKVLTFVSADVAQKTAELMCMEFGARMIPKRKTRKVIRIDFNNIEIEYNNIIEAASENRTTIGIIKRAIEGNKYLEAYKYRYADDK